MGTSALDKIAILKAAIFIVEEQRLKLEDLANTVSNHESPWVKITSEAVEDALKDFSSTTSVLADIIRILEKEYNAYMGYSTINTIDLKNEFGIESTAQMTDLEIAELKEKVRSKYSNIPIIINDVKINVTTNEAIVWFIPEETQNNGAEQSKSVEEIP